LAEKLANLKGGCTFHEWTVLREEVENLLFRCAEVGAVAAEEKAKLQRVFDLLVDCMRQALPPKGREALDNAVAQSLNLQRIGGHDFFAQLFRSDTPICAGDVIPSLLSDSVETISTYVNFLGKRTLALDRAAVEAVRIIGIAENEGHVIPDADPKFLALIGETHHAPMTL